MPGRLNSGMKLITRKTAVITAAMSAGLGRRDSRLARKAPASQAMSRTQVKPSAAKGRAAIAAMEARRMESVYQKPARNCLSSLLWVVLTSRIEQKSA